jgi:hypothetical protein
MFESLIYLDRYRNEGTRTYSNHADFTEAHEKYRPNSIYSHFKLPVFELPRSRVKIYTANPSPELARTYLSDDKALFCIHPQTLEAHQDDVYVKHIMSTGKALKDIPVIPSSSTRTLYVRNDDVPHAIKVHFPFKISRYGRKMRDEVLEQAVNISNELESGLHHFDHRFAFLREVIAVVHKNLQADLPRGENWGYLVRDMKPFPIVDDKRDLIPGFSLYGKDFFDADKAPLLFDLIGNNDPKTFVLESIMLPIIRHWVQCFLHFGFLLEPHGQNILFEVDENRDIVRIVHRDLSMGIDMRRRREVQLNSEKLNAYNRMEDSSFHSITYDKFMGGHFFDRIVATCQEKYPDLEAEDLRKPCRDEFARIFPDSARHFPKTVWYFSEKRDQFNKPLSQDTGEAPEWR